MRLKNSVQENVRWSIRLLASAADSAVASQLVLVDAGADALGLAGQALGFLVVAIDQRRQVGVLARQRQDPDRVEGGQQRRRSAPPARAADGRRARCRTGGSRGSSRSTTPPAPTSRPGPGAAAPRGRAAGCRRPAASTSSSSGRRRDPIPQFDGRPEVDRLDRHPEALLEQPAEPLGFLGAEHGRAGQHDPREAAAAQPILVIHRGLMDEIRQVAVPPRAAVAEEDHVDRRGPRRASRSRRRR